MSKLTEDLKSTLEVVSSSVTVLSTVLILVGLLFCSIGFVNLEGTKVTSRESTLLPPVILGGILAVTGLAMFMRESSKQEAGGTGELAKTVVFYSPTIKANSFFIELLDYSVELANQKGYRLVIEKGNLSAYHDADNYLDIIRKYSKSKAPNTVVIMIPPSPLTYKNIWHLPKDLDVNLITLDMEIEGQQQEFEDCAFHKKVILVNNRMGATLAAQEIISFCQSEALGSINILICDGNFHGRGQLFKNECERLKRDIDLEVCYLGTDEPLSFSEPIQSVRRYLGYHLARSHNELKERDTFIFCANDSLAIGARMEISHFVSGVEERYKPMRIICFDASTFVKTHIDQNDRFFWCAIDQHYTEIVREAFEAAEQLFEGRSVKKDCIEVKPRVHKRYRRMDA